jgi:ribosomal protein S17
MLTSVFKKLVNAALVAALALTLGVALLTPTAAQASVFNSNAECNIETDSDFAGCYTAPIKSINKTNKTIVIEVFDGFDDNFEPVFKDQLVRTNAKTKYVGVAGFNNFKIGDNVTIASTQQLSDGSIVADSITRN